jgi:hypothetical protein
MRKCVLIACCVMALVTGAFGQPVYVLEEVPSLGGVESYATAISDSGWVVGGGQLSNGTRQALRFRDGHIEALGTLPGLAYSAAYAVNNSGDAVGVCSAASNLYGSSSVAVLFRQGQVIRLDSGTPTSSSSASGINDAGEIAGSRLFNAPAFYGAARWVPDAGGTGFERQLITPPGSCFSYGLCINQAGVIAGYAAPSGACGTNLAFVGTPERAVLLPTLGGENAQAQAINDLGDVVGLSEDSQMHNRATLWHDGRAVNLGTLGGASFATGINNEGVVVGYYLDQTNRQRACVWIEGQMIDLAFTMVPEGFRPLIALGINNNGEIVGQGRNAAGRLRGFVLHPTDRPRCAADFNSDGGIDGADVTAFFAAWEAGDITADVNFDGGVDGADAGTFYDRWEAGSC